MLRKIVYELSPQSVGSAIKELKTYNRSIRNRYDEVCFKLAEIGREEAQRRFDQAKDGNGGVRVSVVKIPNGYKIVASGEDVYFIEFGTGDQVSTHYDTSVPVAWGTWSAEHDQILWNQGFWWYGGDKLTGTKAEMPMFYAERAMRENEKRIVKEIFGK